MKTNETSPVVSKSPNSVAGRVRKPLTPDILQKGPVGTTLCLMLRRITSCGSRLLVCKGNAATGCNTSLALDRSTSGFPVNSRSSSLESLPAPQRLPNEILHLIASYAALSYSLPYILAKHTSTLLSVPRTTPPVSSSNSSEEDDDDEDDEPPPTTYSLPSLTGTFEERLRTYNQYLSVVLDLGLVNRSFWIAVEPYLYGFLWLSSARRTQKIVTRLMQLHKDRINSSKPLSSACPGSACAAAIRRLHIETPTLERCDPIHVSILLGLATNLEVFEDYKSIRRARAGVSLVAFQPDPVMPSRSVHLKSSTIIGESGVNGFEDMRLGDAVDTSSEKFLELLLGSPASVASVSTNDNDEGSNPAAFSQFITQRGGVRSLVWTEYDSNSSGSTSTLLLHAFGLAANSPAGPVAFLNRLGSLLMQENSLNNVSLPISASNLELLELHFSTSDSGRPFSHLGSNALLGSSDGSSWAMTILALPALQTLKVTLDNQVLAMLARWDLPLLRSCGIVSQDFSLAGGGFYQFFCAHGHHIRELEFSGSMSGSGAAGGGRTCEETWVVKERSSVNADHPPLPQTLPGLLPVLKTFICCSSNVEWNWENPDWIAPHALLPKHPTVEFIGVRDMERRVTEVVCTVIQQQSKSSHSTSKFSKMRGWMKRKDSFPSVEVENGDASGDANSPGAAANPTPPPREADPFFMLLEQIESLVSKETFPRLKFIRDLSEQSDELRRGVSWVYRNLPEESKRQGKRPLKKVRSQARPDPFSISLRGWAARMEDDKQIEAQHDVEPELYSLQRLKFRRARRSVEGDLSKDFDVENDAGGAPSSLVPFPTLLVHTTCTVSTNAPPPTPSLPPPHTPHDVVLGFWSKVFDMTSKSRVYVEDCRGGNITRRDLVRWAAEASRDD